MNQTYLFITSAFLAVIVAVYLIACVIYGTPAMIDAFVSWWTGMPVDVIAYCNQGDNMTTKAVCTGGSVGVE